MSFLNERCETKSFESTIFQALHVDLYRHHLLGPGQYDLVNNSISHYHDFCFTQEETEVDRGSNLPRKNTAVTNNLRSTSSFLVFLLSHQNLFSLPHQKKKKKD